VSTLGRLRCLAWLEGASLLVLLFVAMPLKHFWGMPAPVRIVGSFHGLLFVMFCVTLFHIALERSWSWQRGLRVLFLATLPGGILFLDRRLKREVA
jgi:integral membrane protein